MEAHEAHRPFVGESPDELLRNARFAEDAPSKEGRGGHAAEDLVQVEVLQQMEVWVGRAPAGEEREAAVGAIALHLGHAGSTRAKRLEDSDEGGEAHAVCHRDRRHRDKHRHGKRARASGTGRERGGPT